MRTFQRAAVPQVHCIVTIPGALGRCHFWLGRRSACALGGAAVNCAFIEHFQDIAREHFTVRRLLRIYRRERIRAQYDLITRQL
jgi:hypothetical protein